VLLVSTIDIVLWAISQKSPIRPEAIRICWSVSRATSFRWRDALEDARLRAQSIPRPMPPGTRRPVFSSDQIAEFIAPELSA
jgi:hypothetical protein